MGPPLDAAPLPVLPARTRRRWIAGCAVLLLLALPASDSLPLLQWNVHIWQRLRREHKIAPDVSRDAQAGLLAAYLPVSGPIGLVHSGVASPQDRAQVQFLLQYSLAPRRLVLSSDARFVIVAGEGSARSPLLDAARFELLRSFGEGLSVFRRID